MSDKSELRHKIKGAIFDTPIFGLWSDNLAVSLCSRLENTMDISDDSELDDFDCWPKEVTDKYTEIEEMILDRVMKKIGDV